MDFLTLVIVVVVGALAVGLLGFVIPAGLRKPFVQQEESFAPALPEGLPEMVRRWLDVSGLAQAPGGDLAAWGLGKMAGPNLLLLGRLWLPLRWTLFLQPGEAFVWRAQITWWRRKFISGGDTLYQGKGMFDMGANQLEGENLDASQFTLLWVYSLLLAAPAALSRPGLAWLAETQDAVTLQVPYGEDHKRDFTLEFDPASGHLRKVSTLRTTARKGDQQPFYVSLVGGMRPLADGELTFQMPERLELGWDDFTYQRIFLKGLAYGFSGVEEEIARGIRAF